MKNSDSPKFAQHLKVTDYRSQPWKNGKGVTEEIAIFPEGCTTEKDDFLWRLSTATLPEGVSAFSTFAGCDRFLILLEGEKVQFHFDDEKRNQFVNPGEMIRFSGEALVRSEVKKGPARDLNLIVRHGKVKVEIDLLQIRAKPRSFQLRSKVTFIFILKGSVKASVYPGEANFSLRAMETLRINPLPSGEKDERLLLLDSGGGGCEFVAIEVNG